MSETIDVNGVKETMTCEICPKKRDQEWLLASFDKGGDNKLLFPHFLEPQVYINMPFGRFIIDRLKELHPELFEGVTIQYRGIGVKQSFWQKSFTQGYVLSYYEKNYALLPNPQKMHLALVCSS